MGAERMHPPRYWRMRAEEFRTKADNCEYAETREVLRKVAENYDELARRAARICTVPTLDERQRQEAHHVVQDYAEDQRAIMGRLGAPMN
jgi:thymidylate kinase